MRRWHERLSPRSAPASSVAAAYTFDIRQIFTREHQRRYHSPLHIHDFFAFRREVFNDIRCNIIFTPPSDVLIYSRASYDSLTLANSLIWSSYFLWFSNIFSFPPCRYDFSLPLLSVICVIFQIRHFIISHYSIFSLAAISATSLFQTSFDGLMIFVLIHNIWYFLSMRLSLLVAASLILLLPAFAINIAFAIASRKFLFI